MLSPVHPERSRQRRESVLYECETFRTFSRQVFSDGTIDVKTTQLIAPAVARVMQRPCCIKAHAKQAAGAGATRAEMMEAIWVAAEMRAGAAYAHAALALEAIAAKSKPQEGAP